MKTQVRWLAIFASIAFAVDLVLVILLGYQYPWVGFGTHTTAAGKVIPAKTLWDWLNLLVVPLVLALLGVWFQRATKKSEQRIEKDRQQQRVLDGYLNYVSELLLNSQYVAVVGLGLSRHARKLIRTRTLLALRLLDGRRKAQLLQFLYEANLISIDPAVELNGADLTGAILDEATLRGAELRGVYFNGASIRRAWLEGADLRGSVFLGVDFSGSKLTKALLKTADLGGADLGKTDLTGADLRGAKLRKANLKGATLSHVQALGVDIAKAKLTIGQREQLAAGSRQGGKHGE